MSQGPLRTPQGPSRVSPERSSSLSPSPAVTKTAHAEDAPCTKSTKCSSQALPGTHSSRATAPQLAARCGRVSCAFPEEIPKTAPQRSTTASRNVFPSSPHPLLVHGNHPHYTGKAQNEESPSRIIFWAKSPRDVFSEWDLLPEYQDLIYNPP